MAKLEVKDFKFLKFLRWLSIVEGCSTLVLFGIAMPLKYYFDVPMAVTVFGSIHGCLFLALVFMYFIALDKVPISLGLMLAGIFGAILPFGPFVVDIWIVKLLRTESGGDTPADSGTPSSEQ